MKDFTNKLSVDVTINYADVNNIKTIVRYICMYNEFKIAH